MPEIIRASVIDIIRKYPELTGCKLEEAQLVRDNISDKMHKIWIYSKMGINSLLIEEKMFSYLLVKKKWLTQQDYWNAERKIAAYGKMGITIPLAVYEYLARRRNNMSKLVLCILNDSYSDYAFYETTFAAMERFARKHYTIQLLFGDEVIGFPYAIFNKL